MEEAKYKRKSDDEVELRFEERARLLGYEPGPRLERFRTVFNMLDWRREQKLCKEDLRPLMTDIHQGCAHCYPHTFKVMTYLKHKLCECSPMIPPIDIKKVVSFLSSVNKTC